MNMIVIIIIIITRAKIEEVEFLPLILLLSFIFFCLLINLGAEFDSFFAVGNTY